MAIYKGNFPINFTGGAFRGNTTVGGVLRGNDLIYGTYTPPAPAFTGLLDTYPGAKTAYSVRRLSGTYNGSALKIRRSNDNATLDVGFDSNGDLDTAAITTFVGGNSAYVDTWYDQSGNGYDLTQATTGDQPRIVSTGTLDTVSSIAAPRFLNSEFISNASVNTTDENFVNYFIVAKADSLTGEKIITDAVTGNQALVFTDAGTLKIARGTTANTTLSFGTTLNRLLSILIDSNPTNNCDAWSYTNSILTDGSIGTNTNNGLRLGGTRGATPGAYWDGWMQEFIMYPIDVASDRSDIVTDIATYYSIV